MEKLLPLLASSLHQHRLGNIWIALDGCYLRRPGRGPRRVARWHFTLSQTTQFLRRAVEAIYGVISTIDPPDVKPAIL